MTLPLLARAGLAGALVAGAVAGLTSMSADARDGFSVVNVPTANPRTGSREQRAHPERARVLGRLGQPAADQPGHRERRDLLRLQRVQRRPAHPGDQREQQDRARQERLPGLRRQALHLPGSRDRADRLPDPINLDADAAHRVTLIADKQSNGSAIPVIDGSTWDPWAHRLLFTAELGNAGAVLQSTPDINATVEDISFAFGRGGFEGVQNDSAGNVWVVEDVGGTTVPTSARNPNSFVYRFLPYDKNDLTKGGKMQALAGALGPYRRADHVHRGRRDQPHRRRLHR